MLRRYLLWFFVQVWHRPGSHRSARKGPYGEGSSFLIKASILGLFIIASIFPNFPFPGSPDLDPEPAALLCLRDVQGEQLQVRRRQEAHHPTVLDYYTANICNFQLVQGVSYFLDLMAINTDYSH